MDVLLVQESGETIHKAVTICRIKVEIQYEPIREATVL